MNSTRQVQGMSTLIIRHIHGISSQRVNGRIQLLFRRLKYNFNIHTGSPQKVILQ
uniref:Uncharacterized protein n=1 Tax=Arundo donax TaxID=35708 RepID=A0A0A9F7N4_ARUDO